MWTLFMFEQTVMNKIMNLWLCKATSLLCKQHSTGVACSSETLINEAIRTFLKYSQIMMRLIIIHTHTHTLVHACRWTDVAGSQGSSNNAQLEGTENNGSHHHYPFPCLPHLLSSHLLYPSFIRWTHRLSQKEECVCVFRPPCGAGMAC